MSRNDISIEAGHIYAPDQYRRPSKIRRFEDNFSGEGEVVDESTDHGLRIGRKLREELLQKGLLIQQILFIDDVSPREKQRLSADSWRWELFIQRSSQQILNSQKDIPFHIYQEHTFIQSASRMVEELKEAVATSEDARISSNERALIFGTGKSRENIKLVGYSKEFPELPSCEVLDLCVYLEKFKDSEETVTVLPLDYEAQQERVHQLLQLLKIPTPVTLIFYDNEGKIAKLVQWNEEKTPLSIAVEEVVARI